jgi:hypothetical protein
MTLAAAPFLRWCLAAVASLVALLAWHAAPAASRASEQQLIKAAFVEKFTRFADWPVTSSVNEPGKPFLICVAGPDPFDGALDELAGITPIKGKRAQVRYELEPRQVDACNVLVLTRASSEQLDAYLVRARARAILTIGDAPGFAERGVAINFYQSENRVRFEINHHASRAAGLVLSSRLLTLARLVGEPVP